MRNDGIAFVAGRFGDKEMIVQLPVCKFLPCSGEGLLIYSKCRKICLSYQKG